DRRIEAPRSQGTTIWAELDGSHIVGVTTQDGGLLAILQVPDPHRLIPSPGCQERAVWAKADRMDLSFMPFEGEQFLAGGRLPDLDVVVPAASHLAPVSADGKSREDALVLGLQDCPLFPGEGVPDDHLTAPSEA